MAGFWLSLTAALCWGVLPIALKLTLEQMDAVSITFYRFLAAAAVLALFPGIRAGLKVAIWSRVNIALMVIAAVGLFGNYVLYLLGVHATTANNAQVMIQAAPMLFGLTAALLFKEYVSARRWLAFLGLICGLMLFSRDQLQSILQEEAAAYRSGSLLVLASAVSWVFFALAQKKLLLGIGTLPMLWLLFLGGTITLWPMAHVAGIRSLDAFHMIMLLLCALNTVIAYGAFAEALRVWDASRVSAVLSVSPLITILTSQLTESSQAGRSSPDIHPVGLVGAFLVVASSMMASLGDGRRAQLRRRITWPKL